ncbi:hypothetical protein LIA77_07846 [Sarocladium implicatum]|nr:hypothetical protein LIA77_07846 [Sarocladium implicatum]
MHQPRAEPSPLTLLRVTVQIASPAVIGSKPRRSGDVLHGQPFPDAWPSKELQGIEDHLLSPVCTISPTHAASSDRKTMQDRSLWARVVDGSGVAIPMFSPEFGCPARARMMIMPRMASTQMRTLYKTAKACVSHSQGPGDGV